MIVTLHNERIVDPEQTVCNWVFDRLLKFGGDRGKYIVWKQTETNREEKQIPNREMPMYHELSFKQASEKNVCTVTANVEPAGRTLEKCFCYKRTRNIQIRAVLSWPRMPREQEKVTLWIDRGVWNDDVVERRWRAIILLPTGIRDVICALGHAIVSVARYSHAPLAYPLSSSKAASRSNKHPHVLSARV